METISVVIPARNEEQYIAEALASVAAQTYPREKVECIVVDNGSQDRTTEEALRFAAEHPDLKVTVVSEPVAGVANAKNRGARVASGRLVVFLDADSRMEPTLLQDVAERYRRGSRAGSIRVAADSEDLLERWFFDLMEVGKVLFGIRTQMMYCESALFTRLGGFDPRLRLAEDLDLLRRAKEHCKMDGGGEVCHIRSSSIRTSPRRLRQHPFRLSFAIVFLRWSLAFIGIGRQRDY